MNAGEIGVAAKEHALLARGLLLESAVVGFHIHTRSSLVFPYLWAYMLMNGSYLSFLQFPAAFLALHGSFA